MTFGLGSLFDIYVTFISEIVGQVVGFICDLWLFACIILWLYTIVVKGKQFTLWLHTQRFALEGGFDNKNKNIVTYQALYADVTYGFNVRV